MTQLDKDAVEAIGLVKMDLLGNRAVERRVAGMHPGDVFLANDPYHGGSHLPDLTACLPVFVGDRVVGALGRRAATLQAVGDWEAAAGPEDLSLLNVAGVAGRLQSRSPFASAVVWMASAASRRGR